MRNGLSVRKGIARILLATALILLIPLLAMRFTDEVDWDPTDFVVIGSLLIGTGLIYELAIKRVSDTRYRAALTIVLAAALLLVWAELAGGVFGTPFSGQ